jgi:nitrite reductase/ring-hydroxylating ferredoxin subunit
MACQILIGNVDQIPKGEARTFEVNGLRIAVFHTYSGEVFATEPDCPHRGDRWLTASSVEQPSCVRFTIARLICGQERI